MNDSIITIENLGKKYRLTHQAERQRYTALRDVITDGAKRFFRRRTGEEREDSARTEEFWALKDVSFEIKQGDVVGIIGRNGAGKSTLLKILSRITEPTTGRVRIRGRMASLLEVGTGFHPELTGRENIYLNGAILGMKTTEIRWKFDEIVAFAEVDKFLDTPVKRYSSGMYVRLAFAVAAHLEPEILVIDEVLAVGDAQFQKKCLGKMKDVAGDGRTVLFVSHNMSAVQSLCSRALLMSGGRVLGDADVETVIQQYVATASTANSIAFEWDGYSPAITSVSVDSDALNSGDLIVTIGYDSETPVQDPVGGVVLSSSAGQPVWGSNRRFHNAVPISSMSTGKFVRCTALGLPLQPGQYLVSVWLGDWHQDFDSKIDVLTIKIGENQSHALRPSASAVGHLNWPGTWDRVADMRLPNDVRA